MQKPISDLLGFIPGAATSTASLILQQPPVTVESYTAAVVVVVVVRSAEEEPAVSRGGGRDRGARGPERAAALGGDERVPPWSRPSGARARGDQVSAEPR